MILSTFLSLFVLHFSQYLPQFSPTLPTNRAKVPADYVTARISKILQHVYDVPDSSSQNQLNISFFLYVNLGVIGHHQTSLNVLKSS